MTSTTAAVWRELARRTGDGVEVAVLWNVALNRVKVLVSDRRLCRYLDLEVARPDDLRAFSDQFSDVVERLPVRDLETDLSEPVRRAATGSGEPA
ncbi:MAG TPA: hypothetical protein VKC65_00365 [Gaiellaceae bacterium]|nr:hypothetical protein [Gaiellaceae bacterium]